VSLGSAVGSTLAQLLRRPEIVIEDFAGVIEESYPEFFEEIDALSSRYATQNDASINEVSFRAEREIGSATADNSSSLHCNGVDPSPSPITPQAPQGMKATVRDDTSRGRLSAAARNEMKTVETEIKYSGYLDQQRKSIERLKKAEQRAIPEWFDYTKVSGLSREMNEKLQRVRPRTLGQASRIPGVTPAAVSLINVYIEIQARRFGTAQNLAADSR
jgi:hypothetical protein